jgi:prophage regulatory protein
MRLLSFEDLRDKGIRWSRNHLRRKIAQGDFPRGVPLSDQTLGWIEQEIDEYLAACIARRDDADAAARKAKLAAHAKRGSAKAAVLRKRRKQRDQEQNTEVST